jgi:hypothetical protein
VNPPFNSGWPCPGVGSSTASATNNHWVTTATSSTGCTFSETTDLYMTPTTAATQGYTSGNDYAPTSGTNSTVGTGTNNASFCNGLSNAAARSACLAGTTDGCSYNSSSHTVSCPGITANARPASGAWDKGAHQYQAANSPAPPTGLTAVVH